MGICTVKLLGPKRVYIGMRTVELDWTKIVRYEDMRIRTRYTYLGRIGPATVGPHGQDGGRRRVLPVHVGLGIGVRVPTHILVLVGIGIGAASHTLLWHIRAGIVIVVILHQ